MTLDNLLQRPASLLVDGGWRTAGGTARLSVVDPSTGQAFAEIACADAADVGTAASWGPGGSPPSTASST